MHAHPRCPGAPVPRLGAPGFPVGPLVYYGMYVFMYVPPSVYTLYTYTYTTVPCETQRISDVRCSIRGYEG